MWQVTVQEATTQPEEVQAAPGRVGQSPAGKNPHAVALGRLGGKKGGPARAKKLTPEQRKEMAQRAARARWVGRQR